MQKNLTIILILSLYSCGGDNSTNPQTIDHYSEDLQFLNELSSSNGKTVEYFSDFIENVLFDSSGYQSYRIKKMYLGGIGLDSLPASIGNLDSLSILNLNDNNLQYIAESICDVYDQLDTLNIYNNNICTPTIPYCIDQNTTISEFYSSQGCEILPDEGDGLFISDLIDANWSDASPGFIDSLKTIYTKWENYREENVLVSRITEIRYDNKGIQEIPQSIAELDSLEHLQLQKNQIEAIPNYIGNLSRLKHFTIFENKITTLPPKIGFLTNLEVFKIYENDLQEIHSNIGGLTKLKTLWLSENQLTSLPDSMCYILSNPDIDISIDNNKICNNNYPECFSSLVNNSDGQDCDE